MREHLQYIYSALYEDLGYLRNPMVLSQVTKGTARTAVPLWDTHVRLRTDFVVDVQVRGGHPVEFTVHAGYSRPILTVVDGNITASENINSAFGQILRAAIEQLLAGVEVPGLKVKRRPLISAPLWADGRKNELCTLDVFSALNLFRRAVVLGPPGSGKSTVVKALAICHLGALVQPPKLESPSMLGLWERAPVTPVFVELNHLVRWSGFPDLSQSVTAQVLIDFVTSHYAPGSEPFRNHLTGDLISGRAVVILDGLDEVAIPYGVPHALQERRRQLQELVHSLNVRFPACRIVVTSRPAGYSDWTLEGFDVVRLLPLTENETTELAQKLYSSLDRHDLLAGDNLKGLNYELTRVPPELREQPLFATLLLLLFLERQGELPRHRSALLNASVRLLLTTWTLPRLGVASLSELLGCTEDELYNRLAALAFRVHLDFSTDRPQKLDASEPNIKLGTILEELYELGPQVNINQVVEFLSNQAAILVSPAPRAYRFAHRLFREFLAASHLLTRPECGRVLTELLQKDSIAWSEPSLLLGELLLERERYADLWSVVEELLDASTLESEQARAINAFFVWLAGRMVHDRALTKPRSASAKRIIDVLRLSLQQILDPQQGLPPIKRVDAAETLALFGDPRLGVGSTAGVPVIEWSIIPAGPFQMGTSESDVAKITAFYSGPLWDFSKEQPAFEMFLPDFEISRYPVTIDQYQTFVEAADGFSKDEWWTVAGLEWRSHNGPAPAPEDLADRTKPQTYVTWFEAVAFCKWLSAKTATFIHLPTEAQWEKAARGADGRIFPWGDLPADGFANVAAGGVGRIAPVGCFASPEGPWGPEGPMDMIGNVWEWCSTIMQSVSGKFFPYPYSSEDGREDYGGTDDWLRATRGGYHGNVPIVARCAYRGRDVPSARFSRQGFRIARSPEEGAA